MAWGGTTATLHPIQVKNLGGAYVMSTNLTDTGGYADATLGAGSLFGSTGLVLTTANDVCQVPLHRKDGKILFLAAFGAHTSNDTFYPLMMVRKPSQVDAGGGWGGYSTSKPADKLSTHVQPSSTNQFGWEFKISTASITVTATESYTACFGPVNTAKYTFLNSTYQPYIEVMFPPCTAVSKAAAMAAFVNITSAKDSTGVHLIAFELP